MLFLKRINCYKTYVIEAQLPGKISLIKKVEKLSQYFDPTSTYEKQPFEKGINIKSNEMPIAKKSFKCLKNNFLMFRLNYCVDILPKHGFIFPTVEIAVLNQSKTIFDIMNYIETIPTKLC